MHTCLFFLLSHLLLAQEKNNRVSLVFIGDIMQHSPQIRGAYDPATDTYDYSSCFRYIAPTLREADIAIANLEVTLAGKPYSGYPTFSAPDELALAAKNAGIDVMVTANNHALDRRKNGVERTIDMLDSLKILHTGTFKNKEEREQTYPLIIERKGIKIALLNYTFGTNGIPVTEPNVVNYIDTAQISKDILKAKMMNSDFTIAFFHWGYEYNRLPHKEQIAIRNFCRRKGVDMVIGSHPHVLQPMEFENDFLTVYSLGNFVSNQRDRYKDGGLVVRAELEINRETKEVKAVGADYQLVWVYKKPEGTKSNYYILPADDYLSKSIVETDEDKEKMRLFVSDSRKLFAENNLGEIGEYRYTFQYMRSFDLNGDLSKTPEFFRSLPVPAKQTQPIVYQSEKEKPVETLDNSQATSPQPKKSIYRIQFFVSSGELSETDIPHEYIPEVVTEKVDGLTRYLTGSFDSKEDAEQKLEVLKSKTRFKDAYVVER